MNRSIGHGWRGMLLFFLVLATGTFGKIEASPAQDQGDLRSVTLDGRQGLQEVVISVKFLDRAAALYQDVAGWEMRARGEAAPALAALWQVPGMRIEQVVLGAPSAAGGFVRLVKFDAKDPVRIRSSARAFDTGGIFNMNMLVRGIDDLFEDMHDRGCQGFSDPSGFGFAGNLYSGAMLRCHDDIVINLIERLSGDYSDMAPFKAVSPITNSTMIVPDFDNARRFFVDQLGWQIRFESAVTWDEDGTNNFGLPNSLVIDGDVSAQAGSYILGTTDEGGSLEILAFDGLTGIDYSDRTAPPNRGLLMHSIHVPDLDSYLAAISERGIPLHVDKALIQYPPYGPVQAAVIRSPAGSWMMLFEQIALE